MDLGLKDKIAVVTGGSEGIGKAIAMGLAREMSKVAITGRRQKQLHETADEIADRTGAQVYAFAADMTEKEEVKQFVEAVRKKWQTVHILVNNVGCATRALFEELKEKDWQKAVNTNLFSAIFCTEFILPFMRKQKWGRIINIAAVSGKEPSPNLMASNAAKSGLLGFSKTLATEVARNNVLVNTVCPGRILTPQIRKLFGEKERQNIASTYIPIKRFGNAEELANLVVFLGSECASYITGTTVCVDGGISRGLF